MSLSDYELDGLFSAEAPRAHMKLGDLLTLVKTVLEDNLADAFWVVAEIAEMKTSPRGYTHFTLIEKSGASIVAKVNGVMWRQATQTTLPRFRQATGKTLAVGMTVLVKATVEFHVQYGLQLELHDVDAAYTLGEMARQRRETIERLDREGRIQRNKALPFPLAPQRIALISSSGAAGYEDFVHQIATNTFGFALRHELFQCLMQGTEAAGQIVAALDRIGRQASRFDVVVIIRGGGSSVDLSVFDEYSIGKAISECPLPVITGIGHERDESVADLCAHTRAKTPTAAAELLIATLLALANRLETAAIALASHARGRVADECRGIDDAARALVHRTGALVQAEKGRLDRSRAILATGTTRVLEQSKTALTHVETALRLLDPANVLRRGYSITYRGGQAVRGSDGIAAGDLLTTRVFDGTIESRVTGASRNEEDG